MIARGEAYPSRRLTGGAIGSGELATAPPYGAPAIHWGCQPKQCAPRQCFARVARYADDISCGSPMPVCRVRPVAGHSFGDHHRRVPMCLVEHPEEATLIVTQAYGP